MFVTQRRFYAVIFKWVSVKLEEMIGENIHTCLENYSPRLPLLPALSRKVMKPGYCTEDSSSSQALGCVNLCGVYNVSEHTSSIPTKKLTCKYGAIIRFVVQIYTIN